MSANDTMELNSELLVRKLRLAMEVIRHYTLQGTDAEERTAPLNDKAVKAQLARAKGVGDDSVDSVYSENPQHQYLVRVHNAMASHFTALPEALRGHFLSGHRTNSNLKAQLEELIQAVQLTFPKAFNGYEEWLKGTYRSATLSGDPSPPSLVRPPTQIGMKRVHAALVEVLGKGDPRIDKVLNELRSPPSEKARE